MQTKQQQKSWFGKFFSLARISLMFVTKLDMLCVLAGQRTEASPFKVLLS